MANKMTNCKTCGAEIAKSAKVCPNCGAKNPKKKLKKLIVFLVIIGIVFGSFGINMAITSKGQPIVTAANGEEMALGTFEEKYHEYYLNDDVDGFLNEYLPAKVVLSGKILKVDHASVGVSNNGYNVNVDKDASAISDFTIRENQYHFVIYYDLYTKPEEYQFGELKVDDEVTATGYITKDSIAKVKDGKNYYGEQLWSSSSDRLIFVTEADGIVKK